MGTSRRIAVLSLAACLAVGAVAIAHADSPVPGGPDVPSDPTSGVGPSAVNLNPCYAANDTAQAGLDCDTADSDYTPTAKTNDSLFQQVGGARFGERKAPPASFTPITVDFYAVRFFDKNHGYAGGAACKDPNTSFDDLASCTRVPVIWQYTNRVGEGSLWREIYRGDDEGFVAAIAFYDNNRNHAMAVGGTGRYPYREFSNDTTSDPDSDPSGKGRVWETNSDRFSDVDWHEYKADEKPTAPNLPNDPAPIDAGQLTRAAGEGTPDALKPVLKPMRALTALDCSPLEEFCVAGGIQQLFMWHKGKFDASYGNGSPDSNTGASIDPNLEAAPTPKEMRAAINFRFRVRELRFVPADHRAPGEISVVGVTAGCCDANPANDLPRQVIWDNRRWYVGGLWPGTTGDRVPQDVPDSFYALSVRDNGGTSAIATPGGPEKVVEPASRIIRNGNTAQANLVGNLVGDALFCPVGEVSLVTAGFGTGGCSEVLDAAAHPSLSDIRFVAADGDLNGPQTSSASLDFDSANGGVYRRGPDGMIDWAVGEHRRTGQGIAMTTTLAVNVLHAPSPLNCPTPKVDPTCKPASPDEIQKRPKSIALFQLPSYGLNSIAPVGNTGTDWAVGDKGAIVHLGGSGDTGALVPEPNPPRPASAKPAQLPASSSYDGFRQGGQSADSHQPPSFNSRVETKSMPKLTSWGSPRTYRSHALAGEKVETIVPSRDGHEAWALGSGPGDFGGGPLRTTLFHFDGQKWTPCDPLGVAEQLAPDPSCSGLASLVQYREPDGTPRSVNFIAAARVPLENDGDPANDDQFEVMAIGTAYRSKQSDPEQDVVAIYKDGRWSIDQRSTDEIGSQVSILPSFVFGVTLTFSSPSDGWLTTDEQGLVHFDGTHWVPCNQPNGQRAACGDDPAAPVLPDGIQGGTSNPAKAPLRLLQVGKRTYLYGGGHRGSGSPDYPLILHKDPGGKWSNGADDGIGYDPGCASRDGSDTNGDGKADTGNCVADPNAQTGEVDALTVVQNQGGTWSGWASGFVLAGDNQTAQGIAKQLGSEGNAVSQRVAGESFQGLMLHLERSGSSGGYGWKSWTVHDATADYPDQLYYHSYQSDFGSPHDNMPELVALPGHDGDGPALLMRSAHVSPSDGPLLWFNPDHRRWEPFPSPFRLQRSSFFSPGATKAAGSALAPDGQGGIWIAIQRWADGLDPRPRPAGPSTFFYRYSAQVPNPAFTDAPNPAGARRIVGLGADQRGGLWMATDSPTLFRYDRLTGWDRIDVPNWNPGRLVTHTTPANAIAFGSGGEGLLVGDGGRIADLSPAAVQVDPASEAACSRGAPPPCGTGRNLRAAAVAPDGSALVGGDDRALLWRPRGGAFRVIEPPPAAITATITGISMPWPDKAWLTTDHGDVLAGTLDGTGWSWALENQTPEGTVIDTTLDGPSGDVGEDTPLNAIAVDRGGHGFAVGDDGLIIERNEASSEHWRRVRDLPVSRYQSVTLGPGEHPRSALVGGDYGLLLSLVDGRLEVARPADPYDGVGATTSDWRAAEVPGVALVPGAGDVEAWAAEQIESNLLNSERTPFPNVLLHYSSDPGDPFLGGGADKASPLPDTSPHQNGEIDFAAFGKSDCNLTPKESPCTAPIGSNIESDLVPKRIDQQLTESRPGPQFSLFTGDAVQGAGLDHTEMAANQSYDESSNVEGAPSPVELQASLSPSVLHRDWADSVARPLEDAGLPLFGAPGKNDLSRVNRLMGKGGLMPADLDGTNLGWRQAMAEMPAPWGTDTKVQSRDGITWEAVEDNAKKTGSDGTQASTHYAVDGVEGGKKTIRVVVADTSRGSLTASDLLQNPPEEQTAWLDKVLCVKGSQTDTGSCTREPGERAVLLIEAPTYSYGPGGVTDVNSADGSQVEALVLKDQVTAVVQGKLGWNGLYWLQSTGVHSPQPGDPYPAGPPAPINGQEPTPFVVAASAGGKFAADVQSDSASDGYWHGYTVVRLSPDGDPAKTIVEQRPILDWLLVQGKSHVLRAGQAMHLDGVGREPVSTDTPIKYDEISTPAVTHRYDLVYADPDKPWLPKQGETSDDCDPYDCLSSSVGTIDPNSGDVKAGSGAQQRTYALAILSVGKLSTTYPISFEPRPSFRQAPAPPPLPIPPGATPPPAPAPPAPAPPFNPPTLATPPPLAPLPAQTPPVPPAPPAPPGAGPAQLDLFTSPPVLSVAPSISLFPPSPPVINVAPPTPARPVEKAKKVAVQSSGSDSNAKSEVQGMGGDMVQDKQAPEGAAMTRHEPNAFTALSHRDQPSAWARDLQWGGGLTLMALVLAFGWMTVRPTPRRRQPEVPEPAWSEGRFRGGRGGG
jgi:hypothetical protein